MSFLIIKFLRNLELILHLKVKNFEVYIKYIYFKNK